VNDEEATVSDEFVGETWERPALDYGVQSDGREAHEKEYDHVTDDDVTEEATTVPVGAFDGTVERFGQTYSKGEWLRRVNKRPDVTADYEANERRARAEDVRLLVDCCEWADETERSWVMKYTTQLLDRLADEDRGLDLGDATVELTEAAALTIVARDLVSNDPSVTSIEDFDESRTLHSLANNGEAVDTILLSWTETDVTRRDLRNVRHRIRDRLPNDETEVES